MPERRTVSRRQFLKLSALAAGAAALGRGALARLGQTVGATAAQIGAFLPAFRADAQTLGRLIGQDGRELQPVPPSPRSAPQRRKWVMVIDLARCDGCGKCTEACTAMHMVPFGQEWIKVYRMKDNAAAGAYWFPRPCMQCDNPPCVAVCPVDATFKREDGIVLIDQDRCIGCRYCMAACPYSARSFNWAEPPHTAAELARSYSMELNIPHRKGVVEKCVFCPGLLREGQLPACAAGCPMGAIYVGDELEDTVTNSWGETARFSELVHLGGGYRYLEELGTEPRVYYLPHRDHQYPMPETAGQIGQQRG